MVSLRRHEWINLGSGNVKASHLIWLQHYQFPILEISQRLELRDTKYLSTLVQSRVLPTSAYFHDNQTPRSSWSPHRHSDSIVQNTDRASTSQWVRMYSKAPKRTRQSFCSPQYSQCDPFIAPKKSSSLAPQHNYRPPWPCWTPLHSLSSWFSQVLA